MAGLDDLRGQASAVTLGFVIPRASVSELVDPAVFFAGEDIWDIPTEKLHREEEPVQPYYVVMKLPGEKIVISVFRDDDEAAEIWEKEIGIPAERIVRMDESENFWGPAGDTGVTRGTGAAVLRRTPGPPQDG